MADRVVMPQTASVRTDPQRLAWGVLLLAFAAFCVFCVITGIGVNYFLFSSSMPMEAVMSVGRGTVGISSQTIGERWVRKDTVTIYSGTDVSTDPSSQAVIAFVDTSVVNHVIATVTVMNNSFLSLRNTARPRFEWSATDYLIDLSTATGQFDIEVSNGIVRPLQITLRWDQNLLVNLTPGGRYSIDIAGASVRVFNHDGNVSLVLPDSHSGMVIPVGGQGLVNRGIDQITLLSGYINLLQNSDFRELNPDISSGSSAELLTGWLCRNEAADDLRGSYRSQLIDGLMMLRFERYKDTISHGSTTCLQTFGQGFDLNGYTYLSLRARFAINYQSLNACGFEGSECPLMLRIDYRDETGLGRQWIHGFYAANDLQLRLPQRCESCSQEHEFINPKTSYTYDSGNLIPLFPVGQRPISIIGVWFYASGHQYDVQVSEVSLLAGIDDGINQSAVNPVGVN